MNSSATRQLWVEIQFHPHLRMNQKAGAKASFFRCETQCWLWPPEKPCFRCKRRRPDRFLYRKYQMKSLHVCDMYVLCIYICSSMIYIYIHTYFNDIHIHIHMNERQSMPSAVVNKVLPFQTNLCHIWLLYHAFINSSKFPENEGPSLNSTYDNTRGGYATYLAGCPTPPLKCCSVIPWGPTKNNRSDGHGSAGVKKFPTRLRSPSVPSWR